MKRTVLAVMSLMAAAPALAFNAYNDIDPFEFEKEVLVSRKSRAEVHADARAALAAGEIPRGELGAPVLEFRSTKSRTQVAAETREASRLGLLTSRGEAGRRRPTAAEEELVRLAGERAIASNVASTSP